LNAPGESADLVDLLCLSRDENTSQERIASIPNSKLKKEQVASMTLEQEHQLENLDIEIQIAEKQLRVASIRKEIAQVELDCGILQRDLREQLRGSLV
jgi:small-conductance mechanosensitive channel